MTPAVWVGNQRVDLAGRAPIAIGGEASVHAVDGCALKIWHAPTPARARKLAALLARKATFPPEVVAPEEVVTDGPGGVAVGFSMPLLPATFEPISLLGRPALRAARGLTHRTALGLLADLLRALEALHAAGIVVGDLSDQNVAIDPSDALPVRLLDVDSFQIAGLPCEVATEAFLDPHLYGPDVAAPCVTADGGPRTFTPESDGYAFEVLLFRALCGAHPYGGALDAFPTLPRRALARASVLHPEVRTPPRVREAIALLGPSLRAKLEATFERGVRAPVDGRALVQHAATLVACGCGLEIPASLLPCPRCAAPTVGAPSATRGGIRATIVLEANGPVVALAADGESLLAVAVEGGVPHLYVVEGGRITRLAIARDPARSGWDVALGATFVAVSPRAAEPVAPLIVGLRARRGLVLETTTTERVRGTAAMATAGDVFFRVARGTLLAGRPHPRALVERAVATVVSGAARLAGVTFDGAGAAVVLAGALGQPRWGVVTERRALELDAPTLAPGETFREAAAYGDATGVTVLATTRVAGRALVRTARFDAEGHRTADRATPEDVRDAEDVVTNGAARGDAVLLATSRGLVREVASGASKTFAETASLTSAGAPVALAPGGVLVADGRIVRHLEWH